MQSFSRAQKVVLVMLLIAVLGTTAVATVMLVTPPNQASSQSSTSSGETTPIFPVSDSPEPTEAPSSDAAPPGVASLPSPSATAPSEQQEAESKPSAFQPPPVAVAPPAPYPAAPSHLAQPEPEPQPEPEFEPEPTCPAGLVQVALTSVTFAPYEYDDTQSVITVKGTITNETAAAVTVFDDDVPNFQGLNSRGEPIIMQVYGKWDWKPPAGQPRPSSLRLEPGERLSYVVTDTSSNSTINEVEYWYSGGYLGSFEASFDFDGPYWDCPDPLPLEGGGHSVPATNLPPATHK